MYTDYTFSARRTLNAIWLLLLIATIYASIIYVLSSIVFRFTYNIPPSISAVLGTAVSLLLGFRTNAAYERWWEARKIWGAIVNDSRTLVRQIMGFVAIDHSDYDRIAKKMAHLQIAFVYALKNSLRQTNFSFEFEKYLSKEDILYIKEQSNKPNAILSLQQKYISKLHKEKLIDSIQYANLDNTVKNLCDSMGRSERIKNTVFPIHYHSFTRMSIIIYSLLFPFSILLKDAIWMIPLTLIVVFFFTLIETIAIYLQDPFENRNSDTPLSALSRTIEINLLEMVGEENVPKKLIAEKGVLM
jgi:putative membrane protein